MRSNPTVLNNIISILTNNFHGPWRSYMHADADQRNRWWKLFQRKYEWDICFNTKMKKKFKSRVSEWLSKNIGRAGRENKKPDWIGDGDWKVL
ncbi:unnamed protein product [Cuscuta epithymum]|uniref:Uncharacterized protein n=1 Tax=Cuscuta epithymum TaxID=186058 RepID=A0AAV0GBJ5_9ASTE|nr:unnamed protein product [Cuscuta epithymum]